LRGWLRDAQINRDRNLRLQYLAGLGLTQWMAPQIYQSILQHAEAGGPFPERMFVGTPEHVRALRNAIDRQRSIQQMQN
jgi:spermidine synthase